MLMRATDSYNDTLGRCLKWSFLDAIMSVARPAPVSPAYPDMRRRDIASELGITERHAYAIVTDLTVAGYVIKTSGGSTQSLSGAEAVGAARAS